MARSVVARQQGDRYQARFFWLNAARLFLPRSKVIRVGYEVAGAKGFDDVAVFYEAPGLQDDAYDHRILADYHQIKFHTTYGGAFTCEALMDPDFVGAASRSLLQRLQAIEQSLGATAVSRSRFWIASPWPIDHADALGDLVSAQGGALRLDKLGTGGAKSRFGKVRTAWRKHLGLATDDELYAVLRPLRLKPNTPTLEGLEAELEWNLERAGCRVPDADRRLKPYDDLITRLHEGGETTFDRGRIQTVCAEEDLWVGAPPAAATPPVRLGIRSFLRWAEFMGDHTDEMICLVPHFDGRKIRYPVSWGSIRTEVEAFLARAVVAGRSHELELDTHASIAFAAGRSVDPKSGVDIAPVQKGGGRIVWRPATEPRTGPLWSFSSTVVDSNRHGVALAVGVTADVQRDVETYVRKALPDVGRILVAAACPAPGARVVRGPTHAKHLAEDLVAHLRQQRGDAERGATLHVFVAAPNGFTFFFGQLARGLGRTVLYEFDFESNTPGAYEPSVVFDAKDRS